MKDMVLPRDILVMEIDGDGEDQVMHINQAEYTQKILERINVFFIVIKMKYRKAQKGCLNKVLMLGAQVVRPGVLHRPLGGLLHLAGGTRPDVSYAVVRLSKSRLSPARIRQLRYNCLVELSLVDPITRKGYGQQADCSTTRLISEVVFAEGSSLWTYG